MFENIGLTDALAGWRGLLEEALPLLLGSGGAADEAALCAVGQRMKQYLTLLVRGAPHARAHACVFLRLCTASQRRLGLLARAVLHAARYMSCAPRSAPRVACKRVCACSSDRSPRMLARRRFHTICSARCKQRHMHEFGTRIAHGPPPIPPPHPPGHRRFTIWRWAFKC